MFKRTFLFASMLIFLLFSFPVYGQNLALSTPTKLVEVKINQVLAVFENPETLDLPEKQQKEEVAKILCTLVNFKLIFRSALGRKHYKHFSETEFNEFAKLFQCLIINFYFDNIKQNHKDVQIICKKEEKIKVKPKKRKRFSVYTYLAGKNLDPEEDNSVVYKMIQVNDGYMGYDIKIFGVSMVSNYRTQFKKMKKAQIKAKLIEKSS